MTGHSVQVVSMCLPRTVLTVIGMAGICLQEIGLMRRSTAQTSVQNYDY